MVRQPAVAGKFYPANAAMLRQTIKELLKSSVASCETEQPKALIMPHAGYVYSGPIAGPAYAQLITHAQIIRRVILLGPVHRVPVRGLALPDADRFATPLGEVPLDQDAIRRLARMPQVVVSERRTCPGTFAGSATPFLQSVLRLLHPGPACRRQRIRARTWLKCWRRCGADRKR